MKNNTLISIIVPVFNSSQTLSRCIESILEQTYINWELIIVDDGSKDDSLMLCKKYAEKDGRITVFKQENAGVSAARNVGIDKANGDYICFIDSDDAVSPMMVEMLFLAVQDNNADMSICGLKRITHKSTSVLCHYNEVINGSTCIREFIQEHYLKWLVSSPCAKMYKTEYCKKIRFDRKIFLGEDLKFNVCFFEKINTIAVISNPLYLYYDDNANSLTKTYKKGNYESICNIYETTIVILNRMSSEGKVNLKNINYKLFSFCISFMSQNIKNATLKEEYEFIKEICRNNLLQKAVRDLPALSIIMKIYAKAIMKKEILLLFIYSYVKSIFID